MINKFSSVPLYNQLIDVLLQKISEGDYKPGDKIPSEQDLCEIYDISRPTVRQAVKELVQKGILIKQKGKGTFLSENGKKFKISNITGFEYSVLDSDNLYEKNIVSVEQIMLDDDNILSAFRPYTNEFCKVFYEVSNSEHKYGHVCSLVNLQHFPNLVSDIREKKASYEILKAKYPYLPVKSVNNINIDYADKDDSQILGIPQGKAIIRHTSKLYARSGSVVEMIISTYVADMIEIQFEGGK